MASDRYLRITLALKASPKKGKDQVVEGLEDF